MKKITMLMAAAAIALGGMSAAAQTNNSNDDNKSRTECTGKDCKGHRGDRKGHKGGKRGGISPLLEGITLTDAQKQKAETLQSDRRAEMKNLKEGNREQAQKVNEKYNSQLRSLLTPDQAKTFDANKVKMEERRANKKNLKGQKPDCKNCDQKACKDKSGKRGGKHGKHKGDRQGQRPDGQQKK